MYDSEIHLNIGWIGDGGIDMSIGSGQTGRQPAMVRNVFRRLKQLESRAKEVAAARPELHSICFIEPVNKRVASTLTWENGKSVWTHFDPPRDRAEFEPII